MKIQSPASVVYISYPAFAFLACDTAGYLWHKQLLAAEHFAWITGNGSFNIYFVYYGAIFSCALTTLFYNSFFLRWCSAVFFCLFLLVISQSHQEIGYALPGLLSFLLALYPKSNLATQDDLKFLIKTALLGSSFCVLAYKILSLFNGGTLFNQYSSVLVANSLANFESLVLNVLLSLGPTINNIIEVILTMNAVLLPLVIFKNKIQLISLALLMIAFLLRLVLHGYVPSYYLFTILILSALAVFCHFEPTDEKSH